ncbi:MAG: hypothetical protein COA79_03470 [Planctomycetota bacterium]|nr:MAG: hypothetical protein COA79_03470 [Planctomycetota bacterium]
MKRLVLFISVFVFIQVSLFANSFNKASVPLKAKWVVHVDVEKALATTIGKELTALGSKDADKVIFINLAKKVKAFTFYGTDFEKGRCMGIIDGSGDILKLLNLLKTLGVLGDGVNSEKITLEGFEVYKVKVDGKNYYLYSQDTLIYVTKELSLMKLQLGMLLGKEKALSEGEGSGIVLPSDKTIAFSTIGSLPNKGDPVVSEALKNIKAIQGGTYEEGDFGHGEVTLTATSAEKATTLEQFLTGMVAFGKLRTGDKPFILSVLNSVNISKNDDKITIKAKANTTELLKLIKEHHNK